MNRRMIAYVLGILLLCEAGLLLFPTAIALIFSENVVTSFLFSIAILVICGFIFVKCKPKDTTIYARDGLIIVSLGWIVLSLFGALPFFLSGEIPHYIDALFEIISGFTTTGASILARPEDLPRGILYWRSFSHWLGGMGVLVFLLALSPGGNGSGFTMHLLRAESPGPDVGKLVPKMRKTATILYMIYISLTVIDVILLLFGGMHWLDALCIAFGTAGTGGFGTNSASLANYSPYIQYVTAIFMLLFGVNFSCYYLILLRQFKSVFKDEELRLYIGIVAGSVILIMLNLWGTFADAEQTFRHALFQVSSIITTTGYATVDFDLWPTFSKMILMALMIVGACAGSTGGGIKVARVLLLLKSLRRNIHKVMRPKSVRVVRSNGSVVDEQIVDNTNAYLAAYIVIMVVSVILISLDSFSPTTSISAVFACFNNIGPGLEAVGPNCNYSGFSIFSKLVLSMDMLAGRLEIFPILVLFSRSAWKRR